jgi:hypothetical protein
VDLQRVHWAVAQGLKEAKFSHSENPVSQAQPNSGCPDLWERAKSGIEDELRVNRNSSQHRAAQRNQLCQQVQLEMIQQQISQTTNFKTIILQDKLRLKHAESLAAQTSEDVSRLIEILVLGRRWFKIQLEALKMVAVGDSGEIHQGNLQDPDWTDAVQVKRGIVKTVVGVLPMKFLEDQIISAAQ